MKVLLMPERSSQVYLRELARHLESAGVQVADVPVRRRDLVALPAVGPGLRLLWKRLCGYRILHMHWIPFTDQRMLRLFLAYLSLLGIRLVWSIHNVLPHEPRAQDVEDLRLVYKAARVRIVHTRASQERLEKEFGLTGTTFHVPLGHLNDVYPAARDRADARALFGFRAGEFVLLLFGHLRPYKGFDDFVRILQRLPTRFVGLVVGSVHESVAPQLKEAQLVLGNRLQVGTEFVPDDQIATYFAAADAALYPFKAITGTHSVFLSYAFKRPPLVRRLPGMEEVVQDGVTGHLCADVDEFVAKVQELAQDEDRTRQLAEQGHAWVETEFDWVRIADGMRIAYETSLEPAVPAGDRSAPPRG